MFFFLLMIFFFSYPWTFHLVFLPLLVYTIIAYIMAFYISKYIDVNDKRFLKYYLIFIGIVFVLAFLWDRFGIVIDIWN